MFLDELKADLEEACGSQASESTIWHSLQRSGYTMKKITRVAAERSAEKHAQYMNNIGMNYRPNQLVFVDESSCNQWTSYHRRAWALKGKRATRKAFFVHGKRCVLQCSMSSQFDPISVPGIQCCQRFHSMAFSS
ncbi:unnamed protein product [Mycena citricolor]|uniref:Transposase n=1 Tax=Mycena citricolor TaxID=2018698 RepID=A0AAD2Q3S9_9AGAR|nr:unnamed protein product [Mycena citricolor]